MDQRVKTSPVGPAAHVAGTRNQRGLTLMEILLVIVLIGLMSAFAIPKLSDAMNGQNVQSARAAFVGMYAQARSTAIQRGGSATLTLAGNVLRIQSKNPITGVTEAVGNSVDLNGRYGVTVSSTPSNTWIFDPRGIGTAASQSSVTITKSTHSTTIVMSAAGRVIQ
jgi:prepilin-type N-terminal cleavage/methylation domain-containing protein